MINKKNIDKTIKTDQGIFYFRTYVDEDVEKVIKLWETAFKSKMDKKIWKWKYHNNPLGRQIILCLNSDNQAVAMYGGMPFDAKWENREIRLIQLSDVMSHPLYRHVVFENKRLFVHTAETLFTMFAGSPLNLFYYGFPGERSYRVGEHYLNYKRISKGGVYLISETHKLNHIFTPSFGSVSKLSNVNNDFNKLWEKAKTYYPFTVKRNRQFIQWRFFEHPKHKYTIYTYKNWKGEMLAYAIISVKDTVATVVDIFALPKGNAILMLFQKIRTELLSLRVSTIQIWLSKNHFIGDNLMQLGFEEKSQPIGIIPTGRSFDKNLDFEYASANIYYTMADGDLF